jgi:hypothetical protein
MWVIMVDHSGSMGDGFRKSAALAPSWIGSGGAAQVAQLRRTVTQNGKKTVEVVYLVTSDRDAGPPRWPPGPGVTGR